MEQTKTDLRIKNQNLSLEVINQKKDQMRERLHLSSKISSSEGNGEQMKFNLKWINHRNTKTQ